MDVYFYQRVCVLGRYFNLLIFICLCVLKLCLERASYFIWKTIKRSMLVYGIFSLHSAYSLSNGYLVNKLNVFVQKYFC